MNTSTNNFLSDYILEKRLTKILNIEKNRIFVLGVEYPIFIDDGSIDSIKSIKLDTNTSSKLMYQLWSLDFLNSTLHNYTEQIEVVELREKTIRLLVKTLSKLKNSDSLQEVISLLAWVEQERKLIKHSILNKLVSRRIF